MALWKVAAKNLSKVTPSTPHRIDNSPRVYGLNLRYDAGVKTMTFTGEVRSSTRHAGYTVILTFKDIEQTDGLSPEEIVQGFYPKPNLSKNEVLMRCSCPSYRFRFDTANRKARMGTGARFGAYHRLTNRKPNNPNDLPSGCKHLFEFIIYLQNNGFIF